MAAPTRKEFEEKRQAMLARLRAERDHGWPNSGAGGTKGYWGDYHEGYIDLGSYPLIWDEQAAGLEPIPPDEQQLPDHQVRQPELTDPLELDGKLERRAARAAYFHLHGEMEEA